MMIIYDNPAQLFFIVFAGIFMFLFFALYLYREKKLFPFTKRPELLSLIIPRSTSNFWIQSIFLCLSWIFAVIALAGPKGNPRFPEELEKLSEASLANAQLKRKSHEVIFLVDTSASMSVVDTRTGKSRLDYAKEIADEVISHLQGESVSLYGFTSETTNLVPATFDYLYTRLILRDVQINVGDIPGTNFSNVIHYLIQNILPHSHSWVKTIILLSDGEDPQYLTMKENEKKALLDSIKISAKEIPSFHARLNSIGVGSENGGIVPNVTYEKHEVHSSLNIEILKTLSENSQGSYFIANDYSVLSLASDIVEGIKKDKSMKVFSVQDVEFREKNMIYDLYFPIHRLTFFHISFGLEHILQL